MQSISQALRDPAIRRALNELERFLHARPQTRRERLFGVARAERPHAYAPPAAAAGALAASAR